MSLTPGTTIYKDPNASKVYTMDWSNWLVGAATIATSTWSITPPSGESVSALTKDNDINDGTAPQVRLIGGTLGKTYIVMNRIVTNEATPQIDDRSFLVKIGQQ